VEEEERISNASELIEFAPKDGSSGSPSPLRPRKPAILATMRMASPRVGGIAGAMPVR